MIVRWEHAKRIREFIHAAGPAILAASQGDAAGRRAWMAWARAYANSIDPICAPNSIAKGLSEMDDESSRGLIDLDWDVCQRVP
jgi:hypothetical protein